MGSALEVVHHMMCHHLLSNWHDTVLMFHDSHYLPSLSSTVTAKAGIPTQTSSQIISVVNRRTTGASLSYLQHAVPHQLQKHSLLA